jgi:NitT/TauT family transport system ATP-binding protein
VPLVQLGRDDNVEPADAAEIQQASGARLRLAGQSPAMSIEHLTKLYARRDVFTLALDDINLEVAKGEFVAIVGPSGCGKSTLLRIMSGLLAASSGAVKVNSEAVTGPRSDIGIVFQSPVLFPWRTVIDNVLLPVDVLRQQDRSSYVRQARELLALVGLDGFESRYPWELSGGMQQRVAISRALINDPTMMMMDEPFGALDAMTREHMNVELQRIWLERKKTILFITHSIPEAVYLADRVLVMTPRPGRIMTSRRIDLPRPRPLDVMNTSEFGDHVHSLREFFSVTGRLDG